MSLETPLIDEALYLEQERAVAGFRDQRKIEGCTIDPETAIFSCFHVKVLDPYEVRKLPLGDEGVGREKFARAPDGNGWVHFDDIPDVVTAKILEFFSFREVCSPTFARRVSGARTGRRRTGMNAVNLGGEFTGNSTYGDLPKLKCP